MSEQAVTPFTIDVPGQVRRPASPVGRRPVGRGRTGRRVVKPDVFVDELPKAARNLGLR